MSCSPSRSREGWRKSHTVVYDVVQPRQLRGARTLAVRRHIRPFVGKYSTEEDRSRRSWQQSSQAAHALLFGIVELRQTRAICNRCSLTSFAAFSAMTPLGDRFLAVAG
jgi:hypothetical protein